MYVNVRYFFIATYFSLLDSSFYKKYADEFLPGKHNNSILFYGDDGAKMNWKYVKQYMCIRCLCRAFSPTKKGL